MSEKEKMVKVTNRSNGVVLYSIPEKHVRREFHRKETKVVPYDELLSVAARPGGRELIYNYLYVEDVEALRQTLNIQEEPEYFLTEDKIPGWLNSCSIEEFKDALDFAPDGVISLIKRYSVTTPLADTAKIAALKEQKQFDVLNAIENAKEESGAAPAEPVTKKRRTDNVSYHKEEEVKTEEKVADTPEYKIVKK